MGNAQTYKSNERTLKSHCTLQLNANYMQVLTSSTESSKNKKMAFNHWHAVTLNTYIVRTPSQFSSCYSAAFQLQACILIRVISSVDPDLLAS